MSKPDFNQVAELFAQIKKGRIDSAHLQCLMENPNRYNKRLGRFGQIYPVEVNYNLGYNKLLELADQNGGVSREIDKDCFPVKVKGVVQKEFELYEFDQEIENGEYAEGKIRRDGYQVEGQYELLAFIAQNPIEQLRRPIVQLKDSWSGVQVGSCFIYVTCADSQKGRRVMLDRLRGHGSFPMSYRFLVSRIQK